MGEDQASVGEQAAAKEQMSPDENDPVVVRPYH